MSFSYRGYEVTGPIDDDSITLLLKTGLYHLKECSFKRHNTPLISAFMERWQPDTNSFHMSFGEMTSLSMMYTTLWDCL